ncbi:hypothetical protein RJ640_028106 [Escallonia rubra]|uniref:Uncharacterized protein n=1 Tax=Escallonia rubra TaxID=112253 RepID=A0AA88RUR0_9ASTE|nr:hypothetical protein RJ640_028106 [Escallonia rubra]
MYHFFRRTLIDHTAPHTTRKLVRFVETLAISPYKPNLSQDQSLTLSYLTKSCGFSLQSAKRAISVYKINIKSRKKPDAVRELLSSHGLSETRILTLFAKCPRLITVDPEKTLRPKLDFFISLGALGPDLHKILFLHWELFIRSLKNQIIPLLNFLKTFVGTNENLIKVLKRSTNVFSAKIEELMVPNIETLRAHGVPDSQIGKLILINASCLGANRDRFSRAVNEATGMGIDPTTRKFVLTVFTLLRISKLLWAKKKEALMSFGWTESEFDSAFEAQPILMLLSEKKIRDMMDFFVNKIGLKASDVARCPNVVLTSLEKRIIPRYSVLQGLMSKGLIKENFNMVWVFSMNKKRFEVSFVTKYKNVAPEVMKAYEDQVGKDKFLQVTNKS